MPNLLRADWEGVLDLYLGLQAVRVCEVREGSVSKAGFGQSLIVWRELIERNPIFMFEERHA